MVFPLLLKHPVWSVGDGYQVRLGIDPIIGYDVVLSHSTLVNIQHRGLKYLNQDSNRQMSTSTGYWLCANDIGLSGNSGKEWDHYFHLLAHAGIRLRDQSDSIVWNWNESDGQITTQLVYESIIQQHLPPVGRWWFGRLWKWKAPLKVLCFTWLALSNRILTGDYFYRRGGMGPVGFPFCYLAPETVDHLLMHCKLTRQLWNYFSELWDLVFHWNQITLEVGLSEWFKNIWNYPSFPLYFFWGIWHLRNAVLFDDFRLNLVSSQSFLIQYIYEVPIQRRQVDQHITRSPQVDTSRPCRFFDGAAQCGIAGVGCILIILSTEYYELHFGVGEGTNTRTELLALDELLIFSRYLLISELQVFRDSSAIINWACRRNTLRVASLGHWQMRIRSLIEQFSYIDLQHTVRLYNQRVDRLSKIGLRHKEGNIFFKHFGGHQNGVEGSIPFY